ncbi:hypothetical protein [Nocardiopsis sp. CNR-923]|uniref:hypothetical protein n=1 Tax=Nocardiopsis sp. CNR-923 TaxID=1904965 RepID=UPI00096AC347
MDEGHEVAEVFEPGFDLLVGQFGGDTGGQFAKPASELAEVITLQATQVDLEDAFATERESTQDGVDGVEPLLDVFDGGVEGVVEFEQVVAGPGGEFASPFPAAFVETFGLDAVEDLAVAVSGGDGDAEVVFDPAGLEPLEHLLHGCGGSPDVGLCCGGFCPEASAHGSHVGAERVKVGGVPVAGEQGVQVGLLGVGDSGGLFVVDGVDGILDGVLVGGEVAMLLLQLFQPVACEDTQAGRFAEQRLDAVFFGLEGVEDLVGVTEQLDVVLEVGDLLVDAEVVDVGPGGVFDVAVCVALVA